MSTIDDYLATVTPAQQAEFRRIRAVVARVAPATEDGTSYGMPAILYEGRALISFMAAKRHLSIYPFSGKVVDRMRDRLAGYSLSSGTIRFSEDHPIPDDLLEDIVRYRMQEIERQGPKA